MLKLLGQELLFPQPQASSNTIPVGSMIELVLEDTINSKAGAMRAAFILLPPTCTQLRLCIHNHSRQHLAPSRPIITLMFRLMT
tara:strand:- start:221 stop:472 length:252 start_codon:yes stop_codon:yes gene_type:complete